MCGRYIVQGMTSGAPDNVCSIGQSASVIARTCRGAASTQSGKETGKGTMQSPTARRSHTNDLRRTGLA